MVGLCGRGDESAVILEAIKIANGGHITFIHINDPHAGEMSMMMDALDKKSLNLMCFLGYQKLINLL